MTRALHRVAATFVWLFALCLLAAAPMAGAAEVVRSVDNPGNGHTYYLIRGDDPRAGVSWREAQREAAALGGRLVAINSEQERRWLIENFPADDEGMIDYHLWIGLNDADEEGTFVWESGESVDFTAWYGEEPNDAGSGEDYVQIYNFPAGQYAWNDMPEGAMASIGGYQHSVSAIAEVASSSAAEPRAVRTPAQVVDAAPRLGSTPKSSRRPTESASEEAAFAGVYLGEGGRGRPIIVVKKDEDRYEISTPNWVGTGYWDQAKRQYEGVFRYRNNPLGREKMFQPGGSAHKKVGYHRIEPLGRGKFLVAWKTDLIQTEEEGAYVIERVRDQ